MNSKGLTLTEIMISVSIVGLISATAIPAVTNFRETAYENICHKNLQAIDNAKLQWAITEEEADDAEPTEEDMAGYIRGDFPQPVIAGALYDLNDVMTPALCSFHGNGFIDGFGARFPDGIVDLISTGDLDASSVVNKDWCWTETSMIFYTIAQYGFGPWRVWDEMVDINSTPEIEINGNTLKGRSIWHYSDEYMRLQEDALTRQQEHASLGDHTFELQMIDGGGYRVSNTIDEDGYRWDYYDIKGNLIGYSETFDARNLPKSSQGGAYVDKYYYDSDGNLLGGYYWGADWQPVNVGPINVF